jgi:cytochrome b561
MLIAQFAFGWTMPEIGRGTVPERLINWHLSTGIVILFFMLVRVLWRITHTPPPARDDLSALLKLLSRSTHYLLYGLLIALPLLGWTNASARNWPVTLFAVVPLPNLVAAESSFGSQAGDFHATLAIVLLVTVAIHVSGALYHRSVLRDRTPARILW